MTEQSKIPVPDGEQGKSLLERASGTFGLGGFKPAPVPSELAPEPSHVSRRRLARNEIKAKMERAARKAKALEIDVVEPQLSGPGAAEGQPAVIEPIVLQGPEQAIDQARLAEMGMIVPDAPVTTLQEEFRIVKRQLLRAAEEGMTNGLGSRAQRILVSSPLPNEGKTFCAVNLALAMAAERDSEVLLVDADFAKPSILSTLGLTGGKGLMDALANPSIRVEDCIVGTDIAGLWVLPAGNRTNSDSEYLASARTAQVLDRLTQGAPNRIVIFDSPPALAATVAAELAKNVGQTMVVVRADQTGQSALEDALHLLATCPDIKLLLNDAHFSPSGRRFGSYYGYGG